MFYDMNDERQVRLFVACEALRNRIGWELVPPGHNNYPDVAIEFKPAVFISEVDAIVNYVLAGAKEGEG